jgi:hemin uptake protein HemP
MAPTEPETTPDSLQIKGEAATREPRKVSSDDLMQGAIELLITHRNDVYRLRVTRSGKLILHK